MNQNIFLIVDVSTLEVLKSGSIVGSMWVDGPAEPFPETGWMDFPVVVLGWWMEAVLSLENGRYPTGEIQLPFMDGPWQVNLNFTNGRCVASFRRTRPLREEWSAEIAYEVFLETIKDSAARVIEACKLRGWKSPDIDLLRRRVHRARLH